jgi:5-methylcytosine-specific restriction protein A
MSFSHEFYKTKDWRLLRRQKLMGSPLCEYCRLAKAEHVDHKKPHKGNPDLFFDYDNLQSLCRSCHSMKTAKQDGGFGRKSKDFARPMPGVDRNGMPLDENHPWRK